MVSINLEHIKCLKKKGVDCFQMIVKHCYFNSDFLWYWDF